MSEKIGQTNETFGINLQIHEKSLGLLNELSDLNAKNLARCSSYEARQKIPLDFAIKFCLLPLGLIETKHGTIITLAGENESNQDTVDSIKFISGCEARILEARQGTVKQAIFIAYHSDQSFLTEKYLKLKTSEEDSKTKVISDFNRKQATTVVCDFLNNLIKYAVAVSVSDIHIVPRQSGTFVYLRSNGQLLTHSSSICSLTQHAEIISRIKVLAKLDITKKQMPQDGSFKISLSGEEINLRVSTVPTVYGEKIVLRVHGNLAFNKMEELHFDTFTYSMLEDTLALESGIILVCGATGSGKTTTIYGLLEKISRFNKSIVSAEDPVEVILPFISQSAIDEKIGLTYAHCLKSLLRQDPDCIMLGEIRDHDSATTAFNAALTGHLVISSLHAGSVADALLRLKQLGVDNASIKKATRLIMVQKLINRLCDKCKVLDLTRSNHYGIKIHKAVGCVFCDQSGYVGRVPVCEVLKFNDKNNFFISESSIELNEERLQNFPDFFIDFERSLKSQLEKGLIGAKRDN